MLIAKYKSFFWNALFRKSWCLIICLSETKNDANKKIKNWNSVCILSITLILINKKEAVLKISLFFVLCTHWLTSINRSLFGSFLRMLNVPFELVSKVANVACYRPSGSIAQWTNGIAFYFFSYIYE